MRDLRRMSFGGTAAIVTNMGLIIGLDAATAAKTTLMGSLLIVAVADNLTDALSVHIYQESERLPERDAFRTTVTNFFVRLLLSISFIVILLLLPMSVAIYACTVWGFVLLSGLSWLLATARESRPIPEILKHAGVAVMVIAISKIIGDWVPTLIGSS